MQLAHVPNGNLPVPDKSKPVVGPKALRALTQPVRVPSGRATLLDPMEAGIGGLDGVLPIPDPTASWRTMEMQRKNLLNLPYTRLSTLALDLSPQINKGLWDFVRFGNAGAVVDDNISERARENSEAFLRRIGRYYGNFKNHMDSMWADIYVYGSVFPELVLSPGGRGGEDIALNNPLSGRFRRSVHATRGDIYEFGQETRSGFVSHQANPLVRYIGFGRIGNNPYGRPLIAPGVHASLFLLGLTQDLRRMVANYGIAQRDVSLDIEGLLRLIESNPDIAGDDAATAQFINEHIETVQAAIAAVEVDEDFVHASTVQVNYANSPVSMNTQGLDSLVQNLRLDVVNGMKGVSGLSNILDSTTETHITRQLEYFVASVGSVQEEMADMVSDFLTIQNQTSGIRSDAVYLFKKQRTSDRRETAEIRKIETETTISKVDAGITTTDEARAELESFKDELVVTG